MIKRNIKVPTGNILVIDGEYGDLECLSLADYGASVNLNQNKPVSNDTPLLPLSDKWVVTVSTQYGCSMKCKFCDVPKVGPGVNVTRMDLINQINAAISLHPEITKTKRLNVHYARMGEPTFNDNVLEVTKQLSELQLLNNSLIHPVISTMMPRNNKFLERFVRQWIFIIKNKIYEGNAGFQISVNSTDDKERYDMFSGNAMSLLHISDLMKPFKPVGRKIALNFAVANYNVNTDILAYLFSPDHFVCKLTPMHKTSTAINNNITTAGDYTSPEPYMDLDYRLKKSGFETLVFIASENEDLGRITCGNAILSGTMPECEHEIVL